LNGHSNGGQISLDRADQGTGAKVFTLAEWPAFGHGFAPGVSGEM
jgi:hypothetical protein